MYVRTVTCFFPRKKEGWGNIYSRYWLFILAIDFLKFLNFISFFFPSIFMGQNGRVGDRFRLGTFCFFRIGIEKPVVQLKCE